VAALVVAVAAEEAVAVLVVLDSPPVAVGDRSLWEAARRYLGPPDT